MGTFFEDITWPSGLERSEEKSFPRISILKKEISRQARDDLPAQLKGLRSFSKLQDDKNRLGAEIINNMFVYAGDTHPHQAQKPKTLDINTLK